MNIMVKTLLLRDVDLVARAVSTERVPYEDSFCFGACFSCSLNSSGS